jgi:hypothetical protein
MRIRVVLLLCAVLCVSAPVFALSVNELDANFSLMMLGSVPPAGYGQGNSIVQLWGAALPIQITGFFFLEPMLEFFGTYYQWTESNATAVPTQYETGDGFYTFATLISLHAGLDFPLGKVISLGGSIGADFLLRFPFDPANTNPDSVVDRPSSLNFFFTEGRFFYPESRLFLHWKASDVFGLVVNLRAFYPLFHLWDGLNQPFLDQFLFSGGIGVAIRLGKPPTPAVGDTAPQPK